MKKLLVFLLALMMIVPTMNFTTSISAAEKVKLNSTNFPDKNFRNLVKEKFDKNKDGYLSATEIKNAKTLSGVDRGIKSVVGIKHLRYLYKLNLRNNPISELDLKYNTKMKELDIIGTKLKKITNLKYLTKLETIKASQLWVYNQNFENFKSDTVSIYVNPKEPYFSLNIDSQRINLSFINRNINRNINDNEYRYGYSNPYENGYYTRIYGPNYGFYSLIFIFYNQKELLSPCALTITQKTINSVKLDWKKKYDDIQYDSSLYIYPEYYEIYRSTKGQDGPYKRVKLTKKTTFTQKVTPYKEYWYRVEGYRKQANGVKVSLSSYEKSIKTEIKRLCLKHKTGDCEHCPFNGYGPSSYYVNREFRSHNETMTIKLVDNPDADGYELYEMQITYTCGEDYCYNSTHKKTKLKLLQKKSSPTFTYNSNLAVSIRAYRIVGGKKYYSILYQKN